MVITELQSEHFAVTKLCETLGVSSSAYYDWHQDRPTARQRQDNGLRPLVRSIFGEHRRRYGSNCLGSCHPRTSFLRIRSPSVSEPRFV